MSAPTTTELSETFDALTHSYRRHVLYYLRTNSGTVSIDTLAATVADDPGGPPATAERDTSEHIASALYHTHLPKLADTDLITSGLDWQSIEFDGTNEQGKFIDEAARVESYAPPTAGD